MLQASALLDVVWFICIVIISSVELVLFAQQKNSKNNLNTALNNDYNVLTGVCTYF